MTIVGLSLALLTLGAVGSRAPGREAGTFRSQLQLTAANASSARAEVKLEAKGSDTCGCVREEVCTCGAQLEFLRCVHKACADKKCDCPASDLENVCTSAAASCTSDLDMACGKETSCKGWFNQASDGVVGFTLDTEHIGDEAYCGPFGKCQGDLKLAAQLHQAYKGLWLKCQIKDKKDFTSCDAAVTTDHTQCRMPMVQGFKASESIVGKCWLTEGKGDSAVTKDAWFTVTNAHGKMKGKVAPAAVKSRASGAGSRLLGVIAAAACSARLV